MIRGDRCASHLSVTVTIYLRKSTQKRKELFWCTVLKDIYCHLVWWPGSREKKERNGQGTKFTLSRHSPSGVLHSTSHLLNFPPPPNRPLNYESIDGFCSLFPRNLPACLLFLPSTEKYPQDWTQGRMHANPWAISQPFRSFWLALLLLISFDKIHIPGKKKWYPKSLKLRETVGMLSLVLACWVGAPGFHQVFRASQDPLRFLWSLLTQLFIVLPNRYNGSYVISL